MKFSIAIPAFKKRYLQIAVESVLSQTYTDWELVIVDDCSPEDLFSVVKPYLDNPNIRYYRNDKNCGAEHVVDNWNICLSHCTGDYVICMGDDDRLLPNCLQEYAFLIKRYPKLEVYHAQTQIIDDEGNITKELEKRPEWESAISLIWHRWSTRSKQFIGDFCYDTKKLKELGGFHYLPLAWGSDDVSAVRAATVKGIANTQTVCFQYRENPLTITSSSSNARTKMLATKEQYKWFNNFISNTDPALLSQEDRRLYDTLYDVRRLYYFRSIGQNCVDDLKGNPLKIPYWCRNTSIFGFTWITIVRWWITSVLNRIR